MPGASPEGIIRSIKDKILPLKGDILVFPGHGDPTTVKREKDNNPFLA